MYQFALPTDEISHLVNRFFEVHIPCASTFDDNRVIPFGLGTFTFVLKGNPRIECIDGIQTPPSCFLSGQYFPTFSFDNTKPLLFYGIALKPTSAFKLFGIHLAELKNCFIDLADVLGDEAVRLRTELREARSTDTRFTLLNDFISRQLPVAHKYNHLDVLIDLIYQRKGLIKVRDLSDSADVSRRYLEKHFKTMIGLSPGKFIRQVRFNFACSAIAGGESFVNDVIKDFGYYDRSHFMKEFKRHHDKDLSVLAGEEDNIFKEIFSQILRSDSEKKHHPWDL